VTGLFIAGREADLRKTLEEFPEVALVSLDETTTDAVFAFDPEKAFPGAKPQDYLERLNNRLRTLSRGTFSVKPRCTVPRERLKYEEIRVAGLDCKGCSFGAYDTVAKLEGVEQATASFKTGLVTAFIDPQKTSREALIAALKKKNVDILE
jgi:copper chaperone CopZ